MSLVILSWPAKALHPNARVHWSAKSKATKAARTEAAWMTKAARLRVDPGFVHLKVTFRPPDKRKRDDDGMVSAFKAYRDGIADGLGVDDHCFLPSYVIGEPVKGGRIEVEIGG